MNGADNSFIQHDWRKEKGKHMEIKEELHNLITDWKLHAERAQQGHYAAGLFYERFFLYLGIPVIVLSVIVGGSQVLDIISKQIGGIISLCIAVLAGLQTFLKLSQRSEQHRSAGAHYGRIKRTLEETLFTLAGDNGDTKSKVHKIKIQLDSLAQECPEIPRRFL